MFRLHDTAADAVTDVAPARPGQLRICACGPAPDGPAHLGDLRSALLPDLIRRNAERHRWSVLTCRASTGAGPSGSLAATVQADWAALNVAPADFSPLPDESVAATVTMISGLIETGRAYPVPGGSVYFDARHGQDAGRAAGADWLLWNAADRDDDTSWPAPWGRGRPSQSAECSAVAVRCLGDRIDLRIRPASGGLSGRHDEQEHEDAEASAVAGRAVIRHWAESGSVTFEGRTLRAGAQAEAGLAHLTARGLDPLAARLALLEGRYREPLDLTWAALAAASECVLRWRHQVADWADELSRPVSAVYWARFTAALDDDLDTPAALAALRELAADPAIQAGAKFETFAAADRVLALDLVSLIGRPR